MALNILQQLEYKVYVDVQEAAFEVDGVLMSILQTNI